MKTARMAVLLALLTPACALVPEKPGAPAIAKPDLTKKAPPEKVQLGNASWYGAKFEGKQTASGSAYDAAEITAAHRSLPMGSRVRVTNLANEKSVEVEINDRGPYIAGRIIDLSRAAARAIGMLEDGLTRVRIELLALPAGAKF